MSRLFFHMLTDPGDGNVEFDTTTAVGNLSLDIDGSPSGLSFTQVNDGYYVDFTTSGLGTIKISGVAQDEFTNIPLIATEDNVDSTFLQSVAGYIYESGGKLRVYTDGSSAILHAGNIAADGTIVAMQAEIDAISNINSALRSGTRWRTIYSESRIAGVSDGQVAAAASEWVSTDTSRVAKVSFEYEKLEGDTIARFTCEAKNSASDDTYLKLVADGAGFSLSETPIVSSSFVEKTTEYDLSNLDNGLHVMTIDIKVSSGTGTIRKPVVQIRNN